MPDYWSRISISALTRAGDEAERRGASSVEPVHLLLGLLREEKCIASLMLSRQAGVPASRLYERMEASGAVPPLLEDVEGEEDCSEEKRLEPDRVQRTWVRLSMASRRTIDIAYELAESRSGKIGSDYLLYGLIKNSEDPMVADLLKVCGLRLDRLERDLIMGEPAC